jgi:putative peptidoglycan lipid II flippase
LTGDTKAVSARGSSLAGSALAISAIAIGGKLCGFGEKIVVAQHFGATGASDIYFAVMGMLWSAVFVAKELVHPSLLPVFSGTLVKAPGRSDALFRRMFGWVLVVSVVGAAGVLVGAGQIVRLLLPGFDPPRAQAASALLRGLAPGAVLLSLMVVTYTCLNARRRFAVSALGETGLRLIMVLGLAVLAPVWGLGSLGLIVGVAGGACLLFHAWFLPEARGMAGMRPAGPLDGETSAIRRLIGPLIVGVALSHANGLVDNLLASTLPQGQLSYLGYARKIIDAVLLIGPTAVVTVVWAHASALHATGRREEMTDLIHKTMRLLLYVSAPLSCLLIALAAPLTELLFQRGRFDAAAGQATAAAVVIYGLGLTCFAMEGLFVYSFYAMSDTRRPVILGAIFVFVDLGLSIVLMQRWQYLGIAAAAVLAKSGKVLLLGLLLRRNLGGAFSAGLGRFLAMLALACGAGAAAFACGKLAAGYAGLRWAGITVPVSLTVGAGAFLASSGLMEMREPRSLCSLMHAVLGRFLAPGRSTNVP